MGFLFRFGCVVIDAVLGWTLLRCIVSIADYVFVKVDIVRACDVL